MGDGAYTCFAVGESPKAAFFLKKNYMIFCFGENPTFFVKKYIVFAWVRVPELHYFF